MCSKLRDFRLIECALGDRFKVWGWSPNQAAANRVVIEDTVTEARGCRVIRDMRAFKIGCKALEKPSEAKKWLDDHAPCDPPLGFKANVRSPSITNIPKWKSNLADETIGLKWRDVITYTKFVFRPWARIVGRCLQLCVNELCHTRQGLGFQRLVGVRDQAFAIHRFSLQTGSTPLSGDAECMEKDMEDMFWEIPTSEIVLGLEWAAKYLKGSRSRLWFSIAKGGLRHLDRIGLASSSDFYGINFDQVLRYVLFDISQCNLFTLGQLIIQQGIKGVPIGGFLSAQ